MLQAPNQHSSSVNYPDLSPALAEQSRTRKASKNATAAHVDEDQDHLSAEEAELASLTPAQRAQRKAEDEEDKSNRERLMKEGEQGAKEAQVSFPPPPEPVKVIYNDPYLIKAFQQLCAFVRKQNIWENPTSANHLWQNLTTNESRQQLEQYNNQIYTTGRASGQENENICRGWQIPIQQLIEFSALAQCVILAESRGYDRWCLDRGYTSAKGLQFKTQTFPYTAIDMAKRGINCWGQYVDQEVFLLISQLSNEEKLQINNILTEYCHPRRLNLEDIRRDPKEAPMLFGTIESASILAIEGPVSKETGGTVTGPVAGPVTGVGNQQAQTSAIVPVNSTHHQAQPETAPTNGMQPEANVTARKFQGVSIAVNPDGRTFLGQVVYVLKAGGNYSRGVLHTRVIVNEGTEGLPYYSVHPGSEFGTDVALEWFNSGTFNTDKIDLARANFDRLLNFVEVEHTARTTRTKIRIYRIQLKPLHDQMLDSNETWIVKGSLIRIMGHKWFKSYEKAHGMLRRQQNSARDEIETCKRAGIHPDTKVPMTDEDYEAMPWLECDEGEDEDNDDDDSDDDGGSDNNIHYRNVTNKKGVKKSKTSTIAKSLKESKPSDKYPKEAKKKPAGKSNRKNKGNTKETDEDDEEEDQESLSTSSPSNNEDETEQETVIAKTSKKTSKIPSSKEAKKNSEEKFNRKNRGKAKRKDQDDEEEDQETSSASSPRDNEDEGEQETVVTKTSKKTSKTPSRKEAKETDKATNSKMGKKRK